MARHARSVGSTRRISGALAALAIAALAVGVAGSDRAGAAQRPANVVVVMTDDQTQESMRVMPRVRRYLGGEGTTFVNSFVNFPVCCPSRATFLTGQYAHNHDILDIRAPLGGFEKFHATYGANTLAGWLQESGYYTGHVGKYLNEYGDNDPTLVPPGWDEWYAGTDWTTHRYFDYTLNENGVLVRYGWEPQDYQGDVFSQKAVDFITRRAPAGQPFFLSVAYTAPHNGAPNQEGDPCLGSAKPAPRHVGAFADEPLPMPPSFNEFDTSDKPWEVQQRRQFTSQELIDLARHYRCRLESLLHVDEGVARMVHALREAGELDETLIVFTSDNGFLHGEHRIRTGKVFVYEESIRVPLLMRGPGISADTRVGGLVTNADLAPTILDISGASAGALQDGRSLYDPVPVGINARGLVIETTTYTAIRTPRYVYVEHFTGERELYDLDTDPFQLQSLHADQAYAAVMQWLALRLEERRDCAGADCSAPLGNPPSPSPPPPPAPDSPQPLGGAPLPAQASDTSAPETAITKASTGRKAAHANRAKFEFSSSEPGSSFECKLDRKPWRSCASPARIKLRIERDGPRHRFEVRATDPAGNTDGTPAMHTWKVAKR